MTQFDCILCEQYKKTETPIICRTCRKGDLKSNFKPSNKSHWIDCHSLALEASEQLMELGNIENMFKPEYSKCMEALEKIVNLSYEQFSQ